MAVLQPGQLRMGDGLDDGDPVRFDFGTGFSGNGLELGLSFDEREDLTGAVIGS